jgi:hypothetical protein
VAVVALILFAAWHRRRRSNSVTAPDRGKGQTQHQPGGGSVATVGRGMSRPSETASGPQSANTIRLRQAS